MELSRSRVLTGVGRATVSTSLDKPFEANWESLSRHQRPEWYRDAKFGIYFHWGLYSVSAFGNEWYPHWMYLPGRPEYEHHLATYGPLHRFGYKDFATQFTAKHFDADGWVTLFKDCGASYIGPVAEHAVCARHRCSREHRADYIDQARHCTAVGIAEES